MKTCKKSCFDFHLVPNVCTTQKHHRNVCGNKPSWAKNDNFSLFTQHTSGKLRFTHTPNNTNLTNTSSAQLVSCTLKTTELELLKCTAPSHRGLQICQVKLSEKGLNVSLMPFRTDLLFLCRLATICQKSIKIFGAHLLLAQAHSDQWGVQAWISAEQQDQLPPYQSVRWKERDECCWC